MSANQTVTSVELLNAIRAEASANYQASIQEATQDNIAEIGAQITAYDPKFNEFTGLLAKIAKTVTIKRFYQNPLAVFKKEKLETANMIEEYFLRKIKSQLQDPDGADHHAPKRPSFSITYHKENRNETYKTTTSFKQIRNAFRSRDGVEGLMNEIVSAMLSDAQIDEFMLMGELIKRATDGSFTVLVDNPLASEQNAKNLMKSVRTLSNAFERPSSLYHNATKVVGLDTVKDTVILTFTPKRNQVLFIRTDVEAQVDVEVLAHAFNMGKTESTVSRVITLDDLGEDVVAILADEDMLVIHDTFNEILTEINASGAFTNYYQHIDQLLAISPYANVAVFKVQPATPDFEGDTDLMGAFIDTYEDGQKMIVEYNGVNVGVGTVSKYVADGTDYEMLEINELDFVTIEQGNGYPVETSSGIFSISAGIFKLYLI